MSIDFNPLGNDSLWDILPEEHKELSKKHGGVWDYRITTPLSTEDKAEVVLKVIYGRNGIEAGKEYKFELVLVEEGVQETYYDPKPRKFEFNSEGDPVCVACRRILAHLPDAGYYFCDNHKCHMQNKTISHKEMAE